MPGKSSGITTTSQGDLVLVERSGTHVWIYTKTLTLITEINIPGVKKLWGVIRQGKLLFFTDTGLNNIHIVNEAGNYNKKINTKLKFIRNLAIHNNMMFVTTDYDGIYKFTMANNYDIIQYVLFAPASTLLDLPVAIALHNSRVVVVCYFSHNPHIFDLNGTYVVPPVGKEGSGDGEFNNPHDLATDVDGRLFVADKHNTRIVMLSPTGKFLRNIVREVDGISSPFALYVQGNMLYVSSHDQKYSSFDRYYQLYVIQLA